MKFKKTYRLVLEFSAEAPDEIPILDQSESLETEKGV